MGKEPSTASRSCPRIVVSSAHTGDGHQLGDLDRAFRDHEVRIQAQEDFAVDRSGQAACLNLKDRNLNSMSVAIDLRVDLTRGTIQKRLDYAEGCPDEAPIPTCAHIKQPSAGSLSSTRRSAGSGGAYDLVKGHIIRRAASGGETVVGTFGTDDFEEGPRSPSGRWVTIMGNLSEGDYIHRQIYLLDTTTGKIWPIRKEDVRPLRAGELKHLDGVKTADVVGESQLSWLPDAADLLLVNGELVTPGTGTIVELEGDVAF
jgi:hypothetical protein